MLTIARVLKTILEDQEVQFLHPLVLRYLCAARPNDLFTAVEELIEKSNAQRSGYCADLEMAFGRYVVAATIDTVCEDWAEVLDLSARTTGLDSDAGEMCLGVLVRAEFMLAGLAHLPVESLQQMRKAVAEQCHSLLEAVRR